MKIIKRELKTTALILAVILTIGAGYLASFKVEANNTAQTPPFTQNWSTTTLITVDDDWSGVPGIVGFRGDDLNTTIGVDLQTVLGDGSMTPVDVNANRSDPDVFASGGLVEFDGIANPVVAFQGSATADIPHLVIYLNTTGFTNIQVAYNARDIDGAAVDAAQQVNTQYRVGGTGDYANVPGGYIADASAPGATLVTPVSVTLPANANNQSLVEVRIMTGNTFGSDEFIGIDDINITGTGGGTPTPTPAGTPDANVDFDGDAKSDWVVTRPDGGLLTWYISINGTNEFRGPQWGLSTDKRVPADYDNDRKDDIAVYREISGEQSVFYILRSSDSTVRIDNFGIFGDDPRVVADYDGDGADDVAVYRQNAGGQNFFYYRASSNNPNNDVSYVPWGSGEFVRPHSGDFDGDGKADYCVFDQAGIFSLLRSSDSGIEYIDWGLGSETLVPGDFDGDRKDDFCVVRGESGNFVWYILERDGGTQIVQWGVITDFFAPGDYDGDGKQDITIWRPSEATFYVRNSSAFSSLDPLGLSHLTTFQWGTMGDNPEANWYVHSGGVK